MSAYPSPPSKVELLDSALLERIEGSFWDARPPAGPLAAQLGPQFTLDEVSDVEDYIEDERVHRFVRAFPVPCLAGVKVDSPDEQSLPEQITVTLHRLLPDVDWRLEGELAGPLRTYGLLHTSVAAPPDEATTMEVLYQLS